MGGSGKRVKDPEKVKDKEVAAEASEEKKQKRVAVPASSQYTRVRVSGTDLNGDRPVVMAIMGVKGVGWIMSNAICEVGNIDPDKKLRDFEEAEIKKLEDVIKNPVKYSVPPYLVNRRRDLKTGEDMHMTGADLAVSTKFDVQRHVDLKTYRGWRHITGQPVRGQRTRSKFREKGRVVGVLRKAVRISTGSSQAPEQKGKESKEAKK